MNESDKLLRLGVGCFVYFLTRNKTVMDKPLDSGAGLSA